MRRTSTTAHALLGLLSLRLTWPTYRLTKQLQRNMRFFWPRAESRIYDEAKRLVDRGWATAQTVQADGRTRTEYAITAAGRAEMAKWLATPPRPTTLECEALLRVFLAEFCTRDQLHVALDRVRADAEAILAVGRVVGTEYLQGTAPFQDQVHVRALVFDFLWNHASMLHEWADRAETAIARWDAQTPTERARASLAVFEHHLTPGDPTESDG